MNSNYYVAIMAGGVGSRFWPASREARPKQFLDILGIGKTLLQMTYERFLPLIPKENIFVVTNKAYIDLVKEQIPDMTDNQILAEPSRNNTAPCLAFMAFLSIRCCARHASDEVALQCEEDDDRHDDRDEPRCRDELASHSGLTLQALEQDAGRQRPYRNAPRTLDLDILLYDELTLDSPVLVIPHPRMFTRAFVLLPLAEIAPERVTSEQIQAVSQQAIERLSDLS